MTRPGQSPGVVAKPKTMSSRLSNMTFMQRGAYDDARKAAEEGSGPPSAKRMRLSYSESKSQPSTPAKLNDQELKPLGYTGTETLWTLENRVTNTKEDSGESTDDDALPWEVVNIGSGRMSFGKIKSKPTPEQTSSSGTELDFANSSKTKRSSIKDFKKRDKGDHMKVASRTEQL